MPFILIGRSYCKESKRAIISAALSDWDWLVSPSLWYGEERVYITLRALGLLQALTAVCLYRGSLSRFMSVTRLHARMKACDPAHTRTILFAGSCTHTHTHTQTDCRVNVLPGTSSPACPLTRASWNPGWFLFTPLLVNPLLFFHHPSVLYPHTSALPPPSLSSVLLPYLACSPPFSFSSEVPAFRVVSLLILVRSGVPIRGFDSWFWCENLRFVS